MSGKSQLKQAVHVQLNQVNQLQFAKIPTSSLLILTVTYAHLLATWRKQSTYFKSISKTGEMNIKLRQQIKINFKGWILFLIFWEALCISSVVHSSMLRCSLQMTPPVCGWCRRYSNAISIAFPKAWTVPIQRRIPGVQLVQRDSRIMGHVKTEHPYGHQAQPKASIHRRSEVIDLPLTIFLKDVQIAVACDSALSRARRGGWTGRRWRRCRGGRDRRSTGRRGGSDGWSWGSAIDTIAVVKDGF